MYFARGLTVAQSVGYSNRGYVIGEAHAGCS